VTVHDDHWQACTPAGVPRDGSAKDEEAAFLEETFYLTRSRVVLVSFSYIDRAITDDVIYRIVYVGVASEIRNDSSD
jgi:hypothetical protein